MSVSLVYPCIRNGESWNSLGKNSESLYINHGLASLASCLIERKHKVRLLDLREMHNWNEVVQWLSNDEAKVYGITIPTLDYHEAVHVAWLIRKHKPSAKIAVGGPHPSICPAIVSKEPVFDNIFVGEGELTFPDYVEDPEAYPHIIRCERPDLDELPYETREIFNMNKILHAKSPYTGKPFFPMPFINVISGRGCPYQCTFCKPGEDLIFGAFRMRSLSNFIEEIELLNNKYNFQTLMIDDDSFTLNLDYVSQFCDIYEKRIHKPFYCQTRADFICHHPDLVKHMKQAGLDMFFIGFESGTQHMLDFMKKGTTVEQNFEAAEICKALGIKIWANFMVGLPSETKEEMTATFNMIKRINPEHPSGAFFTPIVGTHLYNYCKQNNLLLSDDPAVLGSRNPSIPKIKGLDYKWMWKQMYPRSKLWRRIAKKVLKPIVRSMVKSDV